MIPDLRRMGKILNVQDIFEGQEAPTVILKVVQADPENGGRLINVVRRKADQLEPLPGSLEETAAAQFYESPIERVYKFAAGQMSLDERIYAATGDPVTVENQAQRSAGYFEAMRDVRALIEEIMNELKTRSCAATWYAARDDDGQLTLFDERPRREEMVKGRLWWSKRGRERIPILDEYMPELTSGTCRPCRVTVELIPKGNERE